MRPAGRGQNYQKLHISLLTRKKVCNKMHLAGLEQHETIMVILSATLKKVVLLLAAAVINMTSLNPLAA